MGKNEKKELSKTIKWLISLPDGEMSDKMMSLKQQYIASGKNEPKWLEFQILDKCEEELLELMKWNKNF